MDLLFCLERMLTDFRHLFNSKNFVLFQAFIIGLITDTKGGTLTHLYQASASQTRYWSFPKFLSRGKWDADALAAHLIRYIQQTFGNSVYVYDETKALKTGASQYGLHFFRNFSYQKHRVNQSKFHYGHEFGALGLLCETATQWLLFPVWVKLIAPQTLRDKKDAVSILGKDAQVASKVVRTKMCPVDVRLVVIRTRPKPSKPYRYFCVFTTDMTLEIPQILEYYQRRWQIETAFRDAKQHFGFDAYQVRSRKSINRFVQLSFIAASLTKLIFSTPQPIADRINVSEVCQHLGIHWYHPRKLTQGLRVAYLQSQIRRLRFSASFKEKTNSQNITTDFQQDTALPFDKAA